MLESIATGSSRETGIMPLPGAEFSLALNLSRRLGIRQDRTEGHRIGRANPTQNELLHFEL